MSARLDNFLLGNILQYVQEVDRNAVYGVCKQWREMYHWVNPASSYIALMSAGNIKKASILLHCCESTLVCVDETLACAVQCENLNHVAQFIKRDALLSRAAVQNSIAPLLSLQNGGETWHLAHKLLPLVAPSKPSTLNLGLCSVFFDVYVKVASSQFGIDSDRVERIVKVYWKLCEADPFFIASVLGKCVNELVDQDHDQDHDGPNNLTETERFLAYCTKMDRIIARMTGLQCHEATHELASLLDILASKSIFRWFGIGGHMLFAKDASDNICRVAHIQAISQALRSAATLCCLFSAENITHCDSMISALRLKGEQPSVEDFIEMVQTLNF
jgi:hypothetical protein